MQQKNRSNLEKIFAKPSARKILKIGIVGACISIAGIIASLTKNKPESSDNYGLYEKKEYSVAYYCPEYTSIKGVGLEETVYIVDQKNDGTVDSYARIRNSNSTLVAYYGDTFGQKIPSSLYFEKIPKKVQEIYTQVSEAYKEYYEYKRKYREM
ncbi:MAG TPA: hypothetical protein VEC16_03780 [Alphaproteobacteria bacterium]|nr:hypothetical protein [Alphaproteobacteria bacterium]